MRLPSIDGSTASRIAALALLATISQAQEYPTRPISIVVPFPPGGTTGLAESLSKSLGQPVVVENKPGAGTTLGADYVVTIAQMNHAEDRSRNGDAKLGELPIRTDFFLTRARSMLVAPGGGET
jgi:hypothetical protein